MCIRDSDNPGEDTIPDGDTTMESPAVDGNPGKSDANNNEDGKYSNYKLTKKKAKLLKRYGTINMTTIRKIKECKGNKTTRSNPFSLIGGHLLPEVVMDDTSSDSSGDEDYDTELLKVIPKMKSKEDKNRIKEDLLRMKKTVSSFEAKRDSTAVAKKRGMDTESVNRNIQGVKIAKVPEAKEIMRTVTKADLLPPPSSSRRRPTPNGPSLVVNPDEAPEDRAFLSGENDVFAVEEILTFLVPMRMTANAGAEWTFPDLATLRKLFEDVRGSTMHTDIMDTLISSAVDPAMKVATIILNTKNLMLFQLVRQKIREYTGFPGIAIDTYEKSAFISQHGLTIYIPSQYKAMPIQLIMGILQKKPPQLNHPYKILEKSIFKSKGPNPRPGRSRIGDQIVLLEGSTKFMEELAKFPEKYPFEVS